MPRLAWKGPPRNVKPKSPTMTAIHYLGFDVHKKGVSYCVKRADGRMVERRTTASRTWVLRPEGDQDECSETVPRKMSGH